MNNLQSGSFFLLQMWIPLIRIHGFFFSQVALEVKNLPANAGDIRDVGSIPALGRSPGGEYDNPLCILAWRIPGQRSLEGYTPQGHRELDMTQVT